MRFFPVRLGRQYPKVLISLFITAVFLMHTAGWYSWRFLDQVENFLYDTRIVLTMPGGIDSRIVIVNIDEKSLTEIGHWPWPRNRLADLVNTLFNHYQIAILGFDMFFSERDKSSGLNELERIGKGPLADVPGYQNKLAELRKRLDYDHIFAQSLSHRPVFLGYYFTQTNEIGALRQSGSLPPPVFTRKDYPNRNISARVASGYGANLPELQANAAGGGHLTPWLDEDGVVRRVPLLFEFDGGYYDALAVEMARHILDADKITPLFGGKAGSGYDQVEYLKIGYNRIPVDNHLQALVPYRGYQGSFRYVSAASVLEKKAPLSVLRDKYVLVGTTAPGLYDLRTVPVQKQYAGVEIHANLLAGILDNSIKQFPPYSRGAEFVLLLIVGIILALSLPLLSPVWATLFTAAVALVITGGNLALWQFENLVMPLAPALIMILIIFIVSMSYGFFIEQRLKRRISGMFGQYVPPELVDEMTDNPDMVSFEAENRELTVLFTDIRSFTTISEKLSPAELSSLMNQYLTAMTTLIHNNHGTIDKYIGDAIMAFWGAPLHDPAHARHALETGLQMLERLNAVRMEFMERGWPAIHIGVGINTGMMSVGDMGSEFRRAYTVMGDSVNLGSRLEGLTKSYGVEIIVSEFTRAAVPEFEYRELDVVKVKGKDKPVAIFEPVALKADVTHPELAELAELQDALGKYRSMQWEEAFRLFSELRARTPERKLYSVYLERIDAFRRTPPPPDWDGTYTFTTK